MFEVYYTKLLHTGDTKEADKLIDNIMCQDILINVIFGCESELWKLWLGAVAVRVKHVSIKQNFTFNNCNCFANK